MSVFTPRKQLVDNVPVFNGELSLISSEAVNAGDYVVFSPSRGICHLNISPQIDITGEIPYSSVTITGTMPYVAALTGGNFVVAYRDGSTYPCFNIYNSAGVQQGNATIIVSAACSQITCCSLVDGGFLVYYCGATSYTRFARYDSSGALQDSITIVESAASDFPVAATSLSGGGFVCVYTSGGNVKFGRYNAAGALQGSLVTVSGIGTLTSISAASLADGGFVISYNVVTNEFPTFSRYNSSGVLQGSATTIETGAATGAPMVAGLSGGGFASMHYYGAYNVGIWDASGARVGSAFSGAGPFTSPNICLTPKGTGFAAITGSSTTSVNSGTYSNLGVMGSSALLKTDGATSVGIACLTNGVVVNVYYKSTTITVKSIFANTATATAISPQVPTLSASSTHDALIGSVTIGAVLATSFGYVAPGIDGGFLCLYYGASPYYGRIFTVNKSGTVTNYFTTVTASAVISAVLCPLYSGKFFAQTSAALWLFSSDGALESTTTVTMVNPIWSAPLRSGGAIVGSATGMWFISETGAFAPVIGYPGFADVTSATGLLDGGYVLFSSTSNLQKFARFSAAGVLQGSITTVDTLASVITGSEGNAVITLTNGDFVCVYASAVSTKFARYNSSGTLQGSVTTVKSGDVDAIAATPLIDGGFVIAYSVDALGINYLRFDASGNLAGAGVPYAGAATTFKLKAITTSIGDLVIFWTHNSTTGPTFARYAVEPQVILGVAKTSANASDCLTVITSGVENTPISVITNLDAGTTPVVFDQRSVGGNQGVLLNNTAYLGGLT